MNFAQIAGLGFLMAQAVFAALPILIVYIVLPEVHRARGRPERRCDERVLACASLLCCAALAGCGVPQAPNEIVVQRFFGTCDAEYGTRTDVAKARRRVRNHHDADQQFRAENPDIQVRVSTVAWPGYNQLSAQLAAGDPPDVVTMHESAMPDYPVARAARADG